MSDYPVGTIAVATVRGVEGVRVMHHADGAWSSGHQIGGSWSHIRSQLTGIRPLVVLDHSHIDDALTALKYVVANPGWTDAHQHALTELRDQIEAQTKPPRIDEPGLWGVVEARGPGCSAAPGLWVRRFAVKGDDGNDDWQSAEDQWTYWEALMDPTLIREGVES